MELSSCGPAPVLVTAPHNIHLVRDGQKPHVMEESTTLVAARLANALGGSSLTWRRREQYRSEQRWALSKQRGLCDLCGGEGALLDTSNRDPNFLAESEVRENMWFGRMVEAAERMRWTQSSPRSLHLDVHGCRNPPSHPAHLMVGLGAMQQRAKSHEERHFVARFGSALAAGTAEALQELGLKPEVHVVVPEDPERPPALSGAWAPSSGRYTQTQQAVSFAGFVFACQLEMSLALRRVLAQDKAACERLASAIQSAWDQMCREAPA